MLKFSNTHSTESAQNAHTCSLAPRSPRLVGLGVCVGLRFGEKCGAGDLCRVVKCAELHRLCVLGARSGLPASVFV